MRLFFPNRDERVLNVILIISMACVRDTCSIVNKFVVKHLEWILLSFLEFSSFYAKGRSIYIYILYIFLGLCLFTFA